jgi:molybdate/tungstate transport system substrate-binding protein
MLAAKKYGNPELVEELLGSPQAPAPAGGNNMEKLQSGELDAAMSYRTGTTNNSLPYILLSKDLNLGGDSEAADHPDVSLSINSKVFRPEPLVFYAAALTNAANPAGASAFLKWLQGSEAQTILNSAHYDPPSTAPVLHA